jgi:ribosome-associated protein
MPARENDDESAETSRSAKRREALDVLKLAQTLAMLSDAQLAQVPLDDDLRAEVARTRAVTRQIARKRQTQFLAKQMRKLDHDRDRARADAAALHRVESWRDRLIAEGDDALTELLRAFPRADSQQLRQLARQARAERDGGRPPHAQRELFRLLRELTSAVG